MMKQKVLKWNHYKQSIGLDGIFMGRLRNIAVTVVLYAMHLYCTFSLVVFSHKIILSLFPWQQQKYSKKQTIKNKILLNPAPGSQGILTTVIELIFS